MKKIEAKIVADSINQQGDRITTYILTFPRFILAELNTHRVFSKNSASSRAIPFKKMVEMVDTDPFIPIAWQKDHKGMQGTEYLSKTDKFNLTQFVSVMIDTLNNMIDRSSKDFKQFEKEVEERVNLITGLLSKYAHFTMTLDEWWLFARDKAVEAASIMYVFRVTKQLCNRLLEPFMWHTVLLTGTEFENFFELRCPQYLQQGKFYKSKKDAIKNHPRIKEGLPVTELDWLKVNTGQAEIHMGALAEAMWDAMNESTPKELKEGEWHIPFGDRIDSLDSITDKSPIERLSKEINHTSIAYSEDIETLVIKISTARCARLSYMTFDGEIDYEKDLKLHNSLLESQHMSPFEHCARVMNEEEYNSFIKGEVELGLDTSSGGWGGPPSATYHPNTNTQGWCRNFRGFIQYRHLIENKK